MKGAIDVRNRRVMARYVTVRQHPVAIRRTTDATASTIEYLTARLTEALSLRTRHLENQIQRHSALHLDPGGILTRLRPLTIRST